jgi:hypothetical protein
MMTIMGSSVNLLFCISRFRELLKKESPKISGTGQVIQHLTSHRGLVSVSGKSFLKKT